MRGLLELSWPGPLVREHLKINHNKGWKYYSSSCLVNKSIPFSPCPTKYVIMSSALDSSDLAELLRILRVHSSGRKETQNIEGSCGSWCRNEDACELHLCVRLKYLKCLFWIYSLSVARLSRFESKRGFFRDVIWKISIYCIPLL